MLRHLVVTIIKSHLYRDVNFLRIVGIDGKTEKKLSSSSSEREHFGDLTTTNVTIS